MIRMRKKKMNKMIRYNKSSVNKRKKKIKMIKNKILKNYACTKLKTQIKA